MNWPSMNKTSDNINERNMRKVAGFLFIAGILLVAIHYIFLQNQQLHSDENWLVSIDVSHKTKLPDTIISIQPPYESASIRLVGRNINHPGLSVAPSYRKDVTTRGIRLRAHKPGEYQVGTEFSLQLSQTPHFRGTTNKVITRKHRQFFLLDNEWLQLDNPKIEEKLIDIGLNTIEQEKLPEVIFKFVSEFSNQYSSVLRSVPDILMAHSASHREKSLLMVALCRKAGIPARVITGLELKDDPSASSIYWVEVYVNDGWVSYRPGSGSRQSLPVNYLALDKYGDGIVSASKRKSKITAADFTLDYDIMIERVPATINSPDNTRNEWYQVFILDRLSADTREQLSLLMLLPIGAMLCSLIRQFAGLHSYGVFTPTILALAFTYANIETTMLILVITLALVYFGRPSFHHEMSRTPRLSIIFTLVASGMVMGVSILDYFSLAADGHIILLPIVIITSLIDRFFSTIESQGYHTAFVRLVWTVILTLTILPVLQFKWLGEWILRYPESHLITLSLLIMISYYPFGKHKLPLWLKLLSEPAPKPKPKRKKTTKTEKDIKHDKA